MRDITPLSGRNAETAKQAIDHLTNRVFEALGVIQKQQGTLSMLVSKVDALETALKIREMNLVGLGPTVK